MKSIVDKENGVYPHVLYRWKKQALENLPKLFEDCNKSEQDRQAEHEKQVTELYSEIGRLATSVNWLKKYLGTVSRIAMLEPNASDLPLITQTELLGLNRSGMCDHAVPPSVEEVAIKHRIDEIYTRWPFYGSRRIGVQLNQEEIPVSRPTSATCAK